MKKKKEFWRDVVGYEGLYKVSTMGRVKSLKWGKERILKPGKHSGGYLHVALCKDGKCKTFKVHRLVAQAFIPNPDNLPEVNHIDEDKTNNKVENLSWVTPSENINWGTRNERISKPVVALDKQGRIVAEFPSMIEAQRRGYEDCGISKCCKGKYKAHHGLIWCFKGTSDEEIDRRIAEYPIHGLSKPVIAIDQKTGMVVAEFPSMIEAGRNGYTQTAVSACCRGKRNTHKGLIWKYKDDFDRKMDTSHYDEQS